MDLDDDTPHLEERIVMALKTVYDPEIPVDIYELGLIYGIDITPENDVTVRMTLTVAVLSRLPSRFPPRSSRRSPPSRVCARAKAEIVWEPTWTKEMMSEVAKLQLGFF